LLLVLLLPLALSALQVLAMRWVNPLTSGMMIERRLELRGAADGADIDFRWRDWDALSPALAIAVVAAEDQRFPQHGGFDSEAIEAAWSRYREGGESLRGGSTISQQVAKNLFLWSGRSWLRKGLEAWYTVLIETLWPKRRILEIYLNIAEFGDRIYGAEAAAQHYFGKPARELGDADAARLAAVLPSPRRYQVHSRSDYMHGRQVWIQAQVRQLGGPAYLAPLTDD
jgi:monofunctional biosynthetic peptidoglycan transglycosylase